MTTRRVAAGVVLTLTIGMLAVATSVCDADDVLVAAGERWWSISPDRSNPVACATCHHEADETRGWAASFPKFKPLPPPDARVMTLLQANAEAVRRHYRLVDPLPAATAITAYLASRGAAVLPSPGLVAGQPVFPGRLRALDESVARGRRRFARRCAACHDAGAIRVAVASFPRISGRGPESLEAFIERHAAPLPWDSPAMADVVSYLVSQRAARP